MEQPFLRKIELAIVQAATGKRWNIVSDGTRATQQVTFSVNKTLGSTVNQSTISIYNLSPATRLAMMSKTVEISLYVGWGNVPMSLLTKGIVQQVIPSVEGTDVQTTLNLYDGMSGIAASSLAKTFPVNTTVKTIVLELARAMAMEGVTVQESEVQVEGVVGERGLVVNGRVARELNNLARGYGFTWSVQNGAFRAIKDTQAGKTEHNLSATEGFLFKVVPSFFENQQVLQGIEITALIQPRIQPGDMINLTSHYFPQFSGSYKAHVVTFDGDSHGSNWVMKIQSTGPFPKV